MPATGRAYRPKSTTTLSMYFVMAEKRGIDLHDLNGTTQNDITTGLGAVWHLDQIAPRHALPLMIEE